MVVNDLTGTDLRIIDLNLAAALGSTAGDDQPDAVTINATSGNDAVLIAGSAGGVTVQGLAALVNILRAESTFDRLTVNALAGDDNVDASALQANGIALTANGGDGDDILVGGLGADMLSGGADDDAPHWRSRRRRTRRRTWRQHSHSGLTCIASGCSLRPNS